MGRLVFVSCILTTCLALASCVRVVDPHANAPTMAMAMSPSTSSSSSSGTPLGTDACSEIIFGMADCVPFMTDGSKDMRPDGSCCPGLEMVLKVSDDCICEAIESCTDLVIPLNMNKAVTLPAACGISAPNSFSRCGIPLPSGVSVSPTPKSSPKSPSPKRAPASSINVVPAPSSSVVTAQTRSPNSETYLYLPHFCLFSACFMLHSIVRQNMLFIVISFLFLSSWLLILAYMIVFSWTR